MAFARNTWLIARTIWIEAIRRREIYATVLIALALIVATRLLRFFEVEGLWKFYREISLRVMNLATSLTVILLAARQLPREFERRTLYPLLARPLGRWNFLLGKFLGVMAAAAFCYGLFMAIFLVGQATTGTALNAALFVQFVYLQFWNFAVLAALAFLLSLIFNVDAAMTIALVLYIFSQVFLNLMSFLYDGLGALQQRLLLLLHYVIPQLTLFDASGKVVHSMIGPGGEALLWPSLAGWAIGQLTVYGLLYTGLYLGAAYALFRRRPL